jgi:signal transduction histidine kinase
MTRSSTAIRPVLSALALAHQQLAEQSEQLRDAGRLKDEFVELVSHEFRTPMTSILGYLQLIVEVEDAAEQQGFVEVVNRNAERLLRLVNDFLFVERVEAGKLQLQSSELDLAEIVRRSVTQAEPWAAAAGLSLTCESESVLPTSGDKSRLAQLLDHLVANAIKFTPDGGNVRVSLARVADVARLEVSDTGIGISADDQKHLFERFFRTSAVGEQQIPGSGLGLYIARAIAEAHGGSISVASETGRGTAFRIEVPICHAEAYAAV